jgi:hypothetical protein
MFLFFASHRCFGQRGWRCVVFLAAVLEVTCAAVSVHSAEVSFNREVRPILSEKCWACHGPGTQEASLRLDLAEQATSETESGVIPIVPGELERSEMIRRIEATDDSRMPPDDSHKELSSAEIATLKAWITSGAKYQQHWAYSPLTRPQPPKSASHPVDAFIDAALAERGLETGPPADRQTLLRRVTLDLTGLPPTAAEITAFESDNSADAFERVVERLLASPGFAEQQTLHWLDAVRFADTRGFHSDDEFPIWPYRDYVLRAFQENRPIDQFTREQLAGDLLPGATLEQRLGSAYNRLNRTSVEGGIQEKEYVAKYGADRVRNLGAVWLGQTTGCAECHDHKFDPLKQRDFYALKAFFADLEYPSHSGGELELPSPAQAKLREELVAERTAAHDRLRAAEKTLDSAPFEAAALTDIRTGAADWIFQRAVKVESPEGVQFTLYNDEPLSSELRWEGSNYERRWPGHGVIVAEGPNPDNATYIMTLRPGAGVWRQLGLEVFYEDSLPGNSYGRGNLSYFISEVTVQRVATNGDTQPVTLAAARDDGKGARGERFNGSLAVDGDQQTVWGCPNFDSVGNRFLALRFAAKLPTYEGDLVRVTLRHGGPHRQASTGRFRIGLSASVYSSAAPTPIASMVGAKTANIDEGHAPPWRSNGVTAEELAALGKPAPERSADERKTVRQWRRWSADELVGAAQQLAQLVASEDRLQVEIPRSFVSSQAREPRETRVMPRGNWMDDSGEIVAPATPSYLPHQVTTARATRLDLANWLCSADNPLPARVLANRLWAQLFGRGIAAQLDDFGSQGAAPTHPELLDWLATELQAPQYRADDCHAWDWKHLVRVIVTSAAYQQSSQPSPAALAGDPENQFFTRQNRVQLRGENIRDAALHAGGLVKHRFGGRSVRPYQPEGYLSMLYYPRRGYPLSRGDDLWRRSLYTYWQRTFPNPTILTFDGCTREESQVARASSNTPLQSLTLLNDVVFVEAARVLAEQARSEQSEPSAQVTAAFRRVLSRKPSAAEVKLLIELYDRRLAEFRAAPDLAVKLVATGEYPHTESGAAKEVEETAALTAVIRVMFSLQEAITRN